jgi:hypothetical protein
MDDTVKRKLLSSKWNDSHNYIQISKQVHKLEKKYSFLILRYIILYDNDTCIT